MGTPLWGWAVWMRVRTICRVSRTVPPTSGSSTRSAAPKAAQKGFQPFLCIPCSSVPFWNRVGRDVLFYTETAARA